jgi:hypothetical protein
MAETSPRRIPPWVAFVTGALVALILVLAWTGWQRSRGALRDLDIGRAVPRAPELPISPKLPDAPRIPDAPVPTPR